MNKLIIKPLKHKYYGTEIEVADGDLKGMSFTLWHTTGNPSDRQLEQWGITREQWDKDDMINDSWGCKSKISDMDYICNGHYESKETFEFAKKICNME